MKIKTIDLFAGVGGFRKAFTGYRFKTVFANDSDPMCEKTYRLNFDIPHMTVEDIKDIKSKDIPDFDFLLAGFPCQPFSIAGNRKGFEDKNRGNMFFEIARILRDKKPAGFCLENVKGLKTHNFGTTLNVILNIIDDLGYCVKYKVLNTAEYSDLPQNRERIYFVGFRKEYEWMMDGFNFPSAKLQQKTMREILEKDGDVDEKYYYKDKPLFNKLKCYDIKKNTFYQWRRYYLRENKNGLCPALTANMGTGGHNVPIIRDNIGIRKLTPRECFRLQGFDDKFKFPEDIADSHLYKQAGNSVSIPVVENIANQIGERINYIKLTKWD